MKDVLKLNTEVFGVQFAMMTSVAMKQRYFVDNLAMKEKQ